MLKIIYIFLILFLTTFYFIVPNTMDKSTMLFVFWLVAISVAIFLLNKENNQSLKGQFLKHSNLFLFGYLIVHFQYYLDYLLGNALENNISIWINSNVVVKGMVLSSIGLLCFLLGYNYFNENPRHQFITSKREMKVNVLLILALISLLTFYATVNPLYLAGFYGSEYMGANATYAILVFKILIFAIIIQNCRNMMILKNIPSSFKEYVNTQGYFLVSLIGVYFLSVILSGDRGPLISYSICFYSGYVIVTKEKLSFKAGVLLLFLGIFIITFLGVVRRLDKDLDFSSKVAEAIKSEQNDSDISFMPQTQELAGSVRTLHITLDYIPNNHDFLYGMFQVKQFFVAIPFVNEFLKLIFKDNRTKYKGSSSFITWIDKGDFPNSGTGTSCIADFYFDFGVVGVIVGMLLFGYFIRFLELNLFSSFYIPSLLTHIFGVVYLSFAIYLPRSSILFELRTVLWIFTLLVINKYIFNGNTA